jgi:hypothetical protein
MSVKKSQYLDLFVLILSMSLLSIHSSAGLAGTLFPILKINFSKFNMLVPIIILLIFKIIITIFSPLGQYSTYNFNYIFLIRESFTILLFYTWFIIGLYIYNFTFFISMKWTSVIIVLLLLPIVQVYSSGAPIMATIDASQAIFFLLIFVVFFEKMHSIYLKLLTLGILLSTSFALKSSFTTICGVMLLVIFFIQSTFISRIMVPWRITVVVAIAFLTLASTFADSVNLKDNANSGGNNGETREALAGYALSIFCDFPIFGTPMGRGIIPTGIVEELGWDQYFDPDVAQVVTETYGFQSFDIYALSFHNGFLYLLTRFGIFSLLLLYLIIREVPRRAPLPLVLFSTVMLLSISANVVIESIRAGPGVALVLGALFSFQEKPEATQHEQIRYAGAATGF